MGFRNLLMLSFLVTAFLTVVEGPLGMGICWGAPPDVTFFLDLKKAASSTTDLHFKTPAGHHFNDQAPNVVEHKVGDTWKRADGVELKGGEAYFHWNQAFNLCDGLRAQLYVCDNQNTYCLARIQNFRCEKNKIIAEVGGEGEITAADAQAPESEGDKLFIRNDPDKALALAQEKHKPLLIDFYGIWCPPCNVLDEEVFDSSEFQKAAQDFILLKLDADKPISWPLKSRYKVNGYPTVILATENQEEIARIVGSRTKRAFVGEMKTAFAERNSSFDAKKELADDNNSAKAAYEVGLTYLARGEFAQAHYYLVKASRSWPLADIKRNKLMSAMLGMHVEATSREDRKTYERFLEDALEWYPRQVEVFDRSNELVKVAEEMGDTDVVRKALEDRVSTAKWFLGHPKALKNEEYSRGDLYEVLGDAYHDLGEKEQATDAFAKGAEEYLREIKVSGQDVEKERGNNLERFYCLWKSGKTDEADGFYTKFEKNYPREFTYFFQHAHMLNDLKRYKEAEDKAKTALQFSYGDNRLRVAALLAQIYLGEGENKKAIEVIDGVLANNPLPDDKTIRTHRYYDKLIQIKNKIK